MIKVTYRKAILHLTRKFFARKMAIDVSTAAGVVTHRVDFHARKLPMDALNARIDVYTKRHAQAATYGTLSQSIDTMERAIFRSIKPGDLVYRHRNSR